MRKYLLPVILVSAFILQSEFIIADCSVLPSFNRIGSTLKSIGKSAVQKQQLTASSDITTAQKNIEKLKQEKEKLEKQLVTINSRINQQEKALGSAQSNIKQANTSVSQVNKAKEQNRVNEIDQKISLESQKLELKKLQLAYKAKLETELPGIPNILERKAKLKEFSNSANSLKKSGADFETIMITLKENFELGD